jgi:hypothetical protein
MTPHVCLTISTAFAIVTSSQAAERIPRAGAMEVRERDGPGANHSAGKQIQAWYEQLSRP